MRYSEGKQTGLEGVDHSFRTIFCLLSRNTFVNKYCKVTATNFPVDLRILLEIDIGGI
jgi:hypothetical protein